MNRQWMQWCGTLVVVIALAPSLSCSQETASDEPPQSTGESLEIFKVDPSLYPAITEPPCSYCSTQELKGLIQRSDRVLAWIRANHNGGAMPLKHFLAGPRVVNDTYGLFFYDPDGGYATAFKKDYGYQFHGWRNGVMIVKGRDGTLWSALTGKAIDGPQKGAQLERIPYLMTDWGYWLMLHPESTAYDLFDGKKYEVVDLPSERSPESLKSMGEVDQRLESEALVIGIESSEDQLAIKIDTQQPRASWQTQVGGDDVVAFWYAGTQTASAFKPVVDGQVLTFYADEISPESAPFKDKETGTRWTIAGRAVDGPLKGKALEWAPSVQCRWFAWSAEYPETRLLQQ